MNDSPDTLEGAAKSTTPLAPADESAGWYLYGIARAEPGAGDGIQAFTQADASEPVEAISCGGLLAVGRRVPLDDFSPEALSARAEDPAWIEEMARQHNAVIESVHRTRAVLPAKFGCVYASAEDVQTALREEHDALLSRLNWIDGCDEWGVRLYGDVAAIRQRADVAQESVRRLRQDLASASPGRAYFLQRKLADELANAVDGVLDDLVGQAYAQFARHARAGQVSRHLAGSRITQHDQKEAGVEILRAAFLVPRDSADAFIEDIRRFSESQSGLWSDYSGPWPPYSFAAEVERSD